MGFGRGLCGRGRFGWWLWGGGRGEWLRGVGLGVRWWLGLSEVSVFTTIAFFGSAGFFVEKQEVTVLGLFD